MKAYNPCEGCVKPKRTATCHATCPDYAVKVAADKERRYQAYINKPPCSRGKDRAINKLHKNVLRGRAK